MEKAKARALDVLSKAMDKMDRMASFNRKLTAKVEALRQDNVVFAMFAVKHQDCEDPANCGHGTALKTIVAERDWINAQQVNKRKRKRKTDKANDKTSPTKSPKETTILSFHQEKENQ